MIRQISFKTYGVKIGVRSGDGALLDRIINDIGSILPDGVELIEADECEHFLDLETVGGGDELVIYKDGEKVASAASGESFYNHINSQIRLTTAEFAVGKVFLHAGVVAWKNKAVVIPASSFAGKSTLVAALIKKGAEYYSDEYAVLNEDGSVSPFPKALSMRGTAAGDRAQVDVPPHRFGARVGREPVPVGLILICEFDESETNQKSFAPEILSAGRGMLEILAHAIPVRFNPKFTLEILNKISTRAIIAKSKRGEAETFANLLIEFLNEAF